jgi:hypothetical protein
MNPALKSHPLRWKLPLLALIIGAIAVAASRSLFPAVPVAMALLYLAAAIVAFLAFVSLSLIVTSRINAYVLSKGGTDTQWLWFGSEPPGLARLRERAATQSERSHRKS